MRSSRLRASSVAENLRCRRLELSSVTVSECIQGYSMTLGTRYRPAIAWGALRW